MQINVLEYNTSGWRSDTTGSQTPFECRKIGLPRSLFDGHRRTYDDIHRKKHSYRILL